MAASLIDINLSGSQFVSLKDKNIATPIACCDV